MACYMVKEHMAFTGLAGPHVPIHSLKPLLWRSLTEEPEQYSEVGPSIHLTVRVV